MTVQASQQQWQIERSKRAAQVISIIGANKISKAEVERSVRYVEGMKNVAKNAGSNFGTPTTKLQKDAAKRIAVALRRLMAALSNPHREEFA